MFSTVFHRISGLFASKSAPECRFLLLGLDAAGKTTLLYSLRGGNEVVTTIPTIGFNVETVDVKNTSITCWDVGGCDKIRPLWRHYTRNSSAIIFVVDSNDIERIEDAKTELMLFLREEDLNGAPLLVIANKQDLPRAQSLDSLINSLGLQDATNRPWYIRGTCATANVGVKQSFMWLEAILRGSKLTSAELEGGVTCYEFFEKHSCREEATSCEPTRMATMFDPRRLPAEKVSVPERESWKLRQDTIASWVDRIDDSNEDFLLKLSNYELESWDHYTHIHIGFLLIATYGVQRGFCEAEERISSFIANSSRTNGKSFHRTMTRFWMHMIAYCMYYHDICDRGEFKRFLRVGPSTYDAELWDGKLFSAYYSNALLFSSSARTGIVSPDKRSLPNLCDLLHRSISYQESRGRGDAAIDDPQQKRIALMISDLSYLQNEGQYAVASALGIQA